jgi:hypothetical protein
MIHPEKTATQNWCFPIIFNLLIEYISHSQTECLPAKSWRLVIPFRSSAWFPTGDAWKPWLTRIFGDACCGPLRSPPWPHYRSESGVNSLQAET